MDSALEFVLRKLKDPRQHVTRARNRVRMVAVRPWFVGRSAGIAAYSASCPARSVPAPPTTLLAESSLRLLRRVTPRAGLWRALPIPRITRNLSRAKQKRRPNILNQHLYHRTVVPLLSLIRLGFELASNNDTHTLLECFGHVLRHFAPWELPSPHCQEARVQKVVRHPVHKLPGLRVQEVTRQHTSSPRFIIQPLVHHM